MNTFFHLSTCSTCQKIIKELNLSGIHLKDIKTESISIAEIEKMAELAGSYESLFSRRAMKYKSMGLKDKNLSENDYKSLILSEYTFLKRPVLIYKNNIAMGNSKSAIEKMKSILSNE